jgi:hypothetical protein
VKYLAKATEERVLAALEKCAASVNRAGGGRWELELVNGKAISGIARFLDEWLLIEAPVSDRVGRGDLWRVLGLNAGLEGLSKFVLMPDNWSIRLRADIPLVDEWDDASDREDESAVELTGRLHAECAALKAAFRRYGGELPSGRQDGIAPADSELQRLCSDAGWRFVERSAGKLAIDLDARGGFYQAIVEQRGAGANLSVEIAQTETLAETSRQAMAALLLKTGALVKLARPSVEEHENEVLARFEVRFSAMPNAIELKHALSSLSVACTMCGREARMIKDEVVAREYLAIAGASTHCAVNREGAMLAAAD